ncbi:hypothetical protein NEOLEDRAFT_1151649 [Neolentinus lepideus HHB14362 ss-1]|uniref:Methyltransferase domain-containing protein n=1 Tax=Neolentinus lepideus HHB14362 ss-1 TaxID=1314782 RepID=A0A165NRW8_9AGAM|nr:hypothetical protein NEOLEDRAFT_1151649 [Neolentinus lepideus HHB14362 ss-1]
MDEKPQNKLQNIAAFLADPLISSLILVHPNRLPEPAFTVPTQWRDWWDASNRSLLDWLALLRYSEKVQRGGHTENATTPLSLRWAIDSAIRLQLPRNINVPCSGISDDDSLSVRHESRQSPHTVLPGHASPKSNSQKQSPGAYGMSPKKEHEVTQMINYISELISSSQSLSDVRHVVDVGSGQGYLSRALRDTLHLNVLAVDGDDHQTQGAERRAEKVKKRAGRGKAPEQRVSDSIGSLTHKTIRINSETLRYAVDEWISQQEADRSVPVLIVALHACGSLTPDILRSGDHKWTLAGAVVVGCCYNLMSEPDFPLSQSLATSSHRPSLKLYRSQACTLCDCDPAPYIDHSTRPCSAHNLVLTEHHVQLAAQVPSQWTRTDQALHAAELAMRKVVYRALLGRWVGLLEGKESDSVRRRPAADSESRDGKGTDPQGSRLKQPLDLPPNATSSLPEARLRVRLGKLNDTAYSDWATFLRMASEKTGIVFPEEAFHDPEAVLRRRLEILYMMRCLLGPVVESVILLDRLLWMEEQLDGGADVRLVNLFDQAMGSGRNVAIVIAPRNGSAVEI